MKQLLQKLLNFKIIVVGALLIPVVFLGIDGCATRTTPPAPIVNITSIDDFMAKHSTPTPVAVKPSPTANTNAQLTPLAATNTQPQAHKARASAPVANKVVPTVAAADSTTANWVMPTKGATMGQYSQARKGVDISGHFGQAIYASNSGRVVYSGNGLKGYGNLIIIKHSDNYLSAYAHNKVNLVKEGDVVTRGQKIAEMGRSDDGAAMLHFEVRKNGKPVAPDSVIKQ